MVWKVTRTQENSYSWLARTTDITSKGPWILEPLPVRPPAWGPLPSFTAGGRRRETWGVDVKKELRAVGQVVDRLAQRFPDISRSSIEEAIRQEHKALENGRVRD